MVIDVFFFINKKNHYATDSEETIACTTYHVLLKIKIHWVFYFERKIHWVYSNTFLIVMIKLLINVISLYTQLHQHMLVQVVRSLVSLNLGFRSNQTLLKKLLSKPTKKSGGEFCVFFFVLDGHWKFIVVESRNK